MCLCLSSCQTTERLLFGETTYSIILCLIYRRGFFDLQLKIVHRLFRGDGWETGSYFQSAALAKSFSSARSLPVFTSWSQVHSQTHVVFFRLQKLSLPDPLTAVAFMTFYKQETRVVKGTRPP